MGTWAAVSGCSRLSWSVSARARVVFPLPGLPVIPTTTREARGNASIRRHSASSGAGVVLGRSGGRVMRGSLSQGAQIPALR